MSNEEMRELQFRCNSQFSKIKLGAFASFGAEADCSRQNSV